MDDDETIGVAIVDVDVWDPSQSKITMGKNVLRKTLSADVRAELDAGRNCMLRAWESVKLPACYSGGGDWLRGDLLLGAKGDLRSLLFRREKGLPFSDREGVVRIEPVYGAEISERQSLREMYGTVSKDNTSVLVKVRTNRPVMESEDYSKNDIPTVECFLLAPDDAERMVEFLGPFQRG